MRSSLQCEPVCAGREGTVRSVPGDGIQQDEEGAGCMGRGGGERGGRGGPPASDIRASAGRLRGVHTKAELRQVCLT